MPRSRLRRALRRLAVSAAVLVVALTVASLAYNAVTAGDAAPPTKLYGGPFLRVGDTLVAYRRWGAAGTPIVLLGGFAEPSWVWRAVGPLLARHHRVYALDLPPFGYSQRSGHYTLASWIALVRGFDARLAVRRPLLVGHSLGAAVAVGEALDHPRELRGIVLLDGDALAEGGAPSWLPALLVPPYFTSVYRIATGSDWIVGRALRAAYGKRAPRFDHSALDAWERPFRVAGTAGAFRKLLSYGIQGYRLADLRDVRVRRVVVWGAQDTVDSVFSGRRSAAALHARFVLVPDAGHLSMLAKPREVARVIARAAG